MSDINEVSTEAVAVAELVRLGARPFDISGTPHVLVPEGVTLEDCAAFLPAPTRLQQIVQTADAAAFIGYVGQFGDKARSVVFATRRPAGFSAVLDYHAASNLPSWNAHRVNFVPLQTPSWADWNGANKRRFNQADFAQFIEDHIPDIAEPAGAKLLELARNFEATKAVTFQSQQRVADGSVQFTYNEDVQGTPRSAAMKVPTEITLALAPFEGSKAYKVTARLRYRIGEGGKLELWYDLLRVVDVLDAAFNDVLDDIKKGTADSVRMVLLGSIA
jgi:uncharacterized protein YfdQ (DUF2303 family)